MRRSQVGGRALGQPLLHCSTPLPILGIHDLVTHDYDGHSQQSTGQGASRVGGVGVGGLDAFLWSCSGRGLDAPRYGVG